MDKRRVEKAKALLASGGLTPEEGARRVGFASQSHFTTTFRRLVGTTPKAYREVL